MRRRPSFRLSVVAALAGLLVMAGLASAEAAAGEDRPELSEVGRRALQRFEQADPVGAIALLEGLAERGAITVVDRALLGVLYLEVGRPQEALHRLGPLADRHEADAAVLYNAGRAAGAVGQTATAESFFERSLALVPLSQAGRELGLLHGHQGRTFEAYRLLRPWVERW